MMKALESRMIQSIAAFIVISTSSIAFAQDAKNSDSWLVNGTQISLSKDLEFTTGGVSYFQAGSPISVEQIYHMTGIDYSRPHCLVSTGNPPKEWEQPDGSYKIPAGVTKFTVKSTRYKVTKLKNDGKTMIEFTLTPDGGRRIWVGCNGGMKDNGEEKEITLADLKQALIGQYFQTDAGLNSAVSGLLQKSSEQPAAAVVIDRKDKKAAPKPQNEGSESTQDWPKASRLE